MEFSSRKKLTVHKHLLLRQLATELKQSSCTLFYSKHTSLIQCCNIHMLLFLFQHTVKTKYCWVHCRTSCVASSCPQHSCTKTSTSLLVAHNHTRPCTLPRNENKIHSCQNLKQQIKMWGNTRLITKYTLHSCMNAILCGNALWETMNCKELTKWFALHLTLWSRRSSL
jgi:hypothetical protein